MPAHYEFIPDNFVSFINDKGESFPICGGDMEDGYQPSPEDAMRIAVCLNALAGIPIECLQNLQSPPSGLNLAGLLLARFNLRTILARTEELLP